MDKKYIIGGVAAIVIVGILWVGYSLSQGKNVFGSTACSGITCLSGGLRLVSDTGGDFESDIAALFASTMGVTATTTLSDTVNFNNPAICINFFATSSATRVHLTASTTPTTPSGAAGVMTFDYGACTN